MRVKTGRSRVQLVGVIASRAELGRALHMKQPPDLFEIRLDYLAKIDNHVREQITHLPAALIFTARMAAEGGGKRLSHKTRAALLQKFLPAADYIDVELRSANTAPFRSLLRQARRKGIGWIISFHDFEDTPSVRSLRTKAERARRLGADVFKVATRTDSAAQLQRLLDWVQGDEASWKLAPMGMGRLALESRVLLGAAGSRFAYASVGTPRVAGQPTLNQLRSALACAPKRLI